MRPFAEGEVAKACEVTALYPQVHGAPIHVGDPSAIGIADIAHPDIGDAVEVHPGEIPVFWACGVTPQVVAVKARLPLLISHHPGAMLLTDLRNADLANHRRRRPGQLSMTITEGTMDRC